MQAVRSAVRCKDIKLGADNAAPALIAEALAVYALPIPKAVS